MMKKFKIIFVGIIFLVLPFFVSASSFNTFFISKDFDLRQKEQANAILINTTSKLYFYVDQRWWESQSLKNQNEIRNVLNNLDEEFRNNIYPRLTSVFGFEAKPGIDNDIRITILIHPMHEEVGGYFSPADGFYRIQAPHSNQREMIYLNSQHIRSEIMKVILAHEFIHLITFNQKNIIHNVSEEIWLNDVRAEFAATLLGYNNVLKDSILEARIRNFLNNSTDSLTEWQEGIADYGIVNLFAHYLVDHYGIVILTDSLRSEKVGIASINYALKKNDFQINFSQVWNNFKIAVLVNNCQLGSKFCFLNKHLQNFRIIPRLHFLPPVSETFLQTTDRTTYWSGNWHRIIGGKRVLILEFNGDDRIDFKVPYLLCDFQENCNVNFLELDKNQEGKMTIIDFNKKYSSLTIMPSIQSKLSGFNGEEIKYIFYWKASSIEKTEKEAEGELREQLLGQIKFLENRITQLRAEIKAILITRISCQKIENNLYFGAKNSNQVRCLQEFLRAQGPEVYPEGLITGNFFGLTRTAVIRFQQKHSTEILSPIGLTRGTGIVGPRTINKINQLIKR